MDYACIVVQKRGNVGIISLNRPEVRNALNHQLMEDMLTALNDLDQDSRVGAVVLMGSGVAFCAGHDFTELAGKSLDELRYTFGKSVRILQLITRIGKPVIGAVHGMATAMGCALAAGCDLVVASEDAVFQTPGVDVGFACITPMSALFRSIGRKKCLEMIITGAPIDAHEAERIGLVNRVVPLGRLEDEAFQLASTIASKAPLAVRYGKEAFYTMADMEHSQAYKYAVGMISINAATRDGQEGITSFIEKRPHRPWTGT